MIVKDSNGKIVMTGKNNSDGFWRVDQEQLRRVSALMTKGQEQRYTPEEQARGKAAVELCRRLGHPGELLSRRH